MAQLRPVPDDPDDGFADDEALGESRMTLWEHLTELRDRIIKSVIAVGVCGVLGFVLYPQIFDLLIDPYCAIDQVQRSATGECALYIRAPMDGFVLRVKISAYTGLFLASPVVLWQLWRFMAPGLYEKEKKYAIPFVASSVFLFSSGAALAYWTIPKALQFLLTIAGPDVDALLEPVAYLSFVMLMMAAFGLGFEFPIVLIALQLMGVVSSGRLRAWRRYAILFIVVLVAVITPSGDPISLLSLSVPMVVFYEISILVGRVLERRRRARELAEQS